MPALATHPIRKHKFPAPRLRLEIRDLADAGAVSLLKHIEVSNALEEQVQNVLNLLYNESAPRPDTRSVTLILHDFEGVAYTTGSELDNDHKELHFSTSYIRGIKGDIKLELLGVLCHELVHCFQWNALGTCDGGLIEGIADYVRLNAGVGAKHWSRDGSGEWNAGYQHTGYFLDYLETRFGHGTIKKLNGMLRDNQYDEERLFTSVCDGHKVQTLWQDYRKSLKEDADKPFIAVPTHAPKA